MLDLRLPMGLMFSLVGAMMIVYGLCTWGGAEYTTFAGHQRQLLVGPGPVGLRPDHARPSRWPRPRKNPAKSKK